MTRETALPTTTGDDAKLATLKQFVGAGLASRSLNPTIAKVFPFDEIVDAHRYIESGEQVGKIVVTVRS